MTTSKIPAVLKITTTTPTKQFPCRYHVEVHVDGDFEISETNDASEIGTIIKELEAVYDFSES